MSAIKKLVSQTAIYGVSTILVRMLNYFLTPIQTRVFTDQATFGIVADLYASMAFLNVVYMYGMETGFFRFATNASDKTIVKKTAITTLLISSAFLSGIIVLFSPFISENLGYVLHPEYVWYAAAILFLDNIVNIPFATLRIEERPVKYVIYKAINVCVNVFLNLFLLALPFYFGEISWVSSLFKTLGLSTSPTYHVTYVLVANLVASAITVLFFWRNFLPRNFEINTVLLKKLTTYSLPLLVVGLAGMVNEVADRKMLKYWLPDTLHQNLVQIGIYSAVYKLSIFMTLAIQAFKMGAEPFFFKQSTKDNAPKMYAQIMLHFTVACLVIFLVVSLFVDVFKLMIASNYYEGLYILPILLLANLFLGIYYNLSVWYRLTDKTNYAAYIALFGAGITILFNYILIPKYGYLGAAITTLLCYFLMCVVSYVIGQRFYKVPYQTIKISMYILIAAGIVYLLSTISFSNVFLKYGVHTSAVLGFMALYYILDARKIELKKK